MDAMIWLIAAALTLLFCGMIAVTWWGLNRWWDRRRDAAVLDPDPVLPDEPPEPDSPWNFGYKVWWLALPTEDSASVIDALGLEEVREANWAQGMRAAYDFNRWAFITPPVDGWTFAVGGDYALNFAEEVPRFRAFLEELSRRFGRVYHFRSYRGVSCYSWACAEGGKLIRGFATVEGETLWSEGALTEAERGLGIDWSAEYPGLEVDEEHVLRVAEAWALNPNRVEQMGLPPSTGWIGASPRREEAAVDR